MYKATPESERFFEYFKGGENIFLTGNAGTGKSYLIGKLEQDNPSKNFLKLAPTGVAAMNIKGNTLHRYLGMGIGLYNKDMGFKIKHLDDLRKKLESKYIMQDVGSHMATACEKYVIIVDEISMVRVDLLEILNNSLKKSTGINEPFGGIQTILVGDPYQIPPIRSKEFDELLGHHYDSEFRFHSNAREEGNFKMINLEKIYRQDDINFKNLLNNIRVGTQLDTCLNILNSRLEADIGSGYITLCATRRAVDAYNWKNYIKVDTQEETYYASIAGEFDRSLYPVKKELSIKPGSQVMIRVNNPDQDYVNGTLGIYKGIDEEYDNKAEAHVPVMLIQDLSDETITYRVKQYQRVIKKPQDDGSGIIENIEIGRFTQFPIMQSRAVTINKSQGLTFDKVLIDTDRGLFASGQGYVALSRCKSFEGISLTRKFKESDIIVSSDVIKYFG